MKITESVIKENRRISENLYQCVFAWSDPSIKPGQFFTVRVSGLSSPLLRRPFAFASFSKKTQTSSFIFEVRGRGTQLLADKRAGDRLDIMGPLGTPFPVLKGYNSIISGGIGIGPLLFLASSLKKEGIRYRFFHGCRNSAELPENGLLKEFDIKVSTDDGSTGYHGNAVQLFESSIDSDRPDCIYACGPEPMLRECDRISRDIDSECYVSLEEVMGCGVGACMGCTVETTGPEKYKTVCKDGPVFRSSEIKWI